jgi:hypothetical protein
MSEHVLITTKTCSCDGDKHCPICDGGLSVCSVCGEYEAGLDKPCKAPENKEEGVNDDKRVAVPTELA